MPSYVQKRPIKMYPIPVYSLPMFRLYWLELKNRGGYLMLELFSTWKSCGSSILYWNLPGNGMYLFLWFLGEI